MDPKHLEFFFGRASHQASDLFREYLEQVANKSLIEYREVIQYGGKAGETLYTHILSGIFLLEPLRHLLHLDETETRLLFTGQTLHDLNKIPGVDGKQSFSKLATAEQIEEVLRRFELHKFFPDYQTYLNDIETLVRGHPGHSTVGLERLFVKRGYGLGRERLGEVLLPLVQAVDIIDLSHTLAERRKKEQFLERLNTASANAGGVQYEFITHRLDEQRGSLTNILHNAIVGEFQARFDLVPLLFYPEGVAYLAPRGKALEMSDGLNQAIGRRAAQTVASMVGGNFRDFISRRPAGMKVDPKCLELGIPFGGEEGILREMYSILQRASFDVEDIASKVAQRTGADWARLAALSPEVAAEVEPRLEQPRQFIAESAEQLRLAELVRSYYLFLKDHFESNFPDPWHHLYEILDLPPERHAFYDFFEARYDRAYVLARDLRLSEEALYRRLEADGDALLENTEREDPNRRLLTSYLQHYASFSFAPAGRDAFAQSLPHYIANQHKQCVNCAAPFPTSDWMAADVRSDVTVQSFSNRLRGGPGEPKKQICEVCHLQFLLDKINYPEVRGEKTMYLHLFPYSFLTDFFLKGIRTAIQGILGVEPDNNIKALHLNASTSALKEVAARRSAQLDFSVRTQQDKLHPYGLYLPRFQESVGNLLIFPINPGGTNDSARFLFAIQYALLLQQHFGMKVLLTDSPVAPLHKEDFGDVYMDSIPLSMRGLLRQNDYHYWEGKEEKKGTLQSLWETVGRLLTVRDAVYNPSTKRDELLMLVQTLARPALALFYTVEKLLEQKIRDDQKVKSKEWLLIRQSQSIFEAVQKLANQIGGNQMEKLSEHLNVLAEMAWRERFRGQSLEKNSLMTPLDEIFTKLSHGSEAFDDDALRATIAEDLMEHLVRVTDPKFKPGVQKQLVKLDSCRAFVDYFFDKVLGEVYRGRLARLLTDEKFLRSAFLFYIRQHIPRKRFDGDDEGEAEALDEASN